MKTYRFEDMTVGLSESFSITISDSMMESFFQVTGDENPLHRDRQFAQTNGFSDKVVYGLLTSSFLSTLVGVYLPGRFCLLQGVDVSYKAPVYVGDRLLVTGAVSHISETVRQIEITATICNQDKKKIAKAKIKVGFLHG